MRRRGFTLIEVLAAIGLIAMLTGSLFVFLSSLLGSRGALRARAMDGQAAGALVERLESDVLSGLAGDDAAGAGVSGTATSLKLLTRGVWLPGAKSESNAGDLQSSEYSWSSGVLRGRRWVASQSAPDFETISDHVQALRLRYFDGEKWRDSFDSLSEGTLPVAIEVALWFGEPTAEQSSRQQNVAAAGPPTPKTASNSAKAEPGKPSGQSDRDSSAASPSAALPSREPDRLRVIVVPDGPVTPGKELR